MNISILFIRKLYGSVKLGTFEHRQFFKCLIAKYNNKL